MKEEKLERKDLCLYFNLISSDLYYIESDEIKNLDKYQIPLIKKPKTSCRHCFGRGSEGKDIKTNLYKPCRCMKFCINFDKTPDFIDTEKVTLK